MHLELAREHRPRLPHPARRRLARERRRFRRGVYLLPSALTLGNLFCGYLCVVYSIRGEFGTAAPFVAISVLLDILDGRIARLTGTTSEFGLEFDSLADVISFGLAPAILTVSWGLSPLGRLGWAAGFIFVTAGAIRLARFNIQTNTDKRFFVGLPIPAAASVAASTVYVYPEGLQTTQAAFPALALLIVPAVLMVSTVKFRSFKSFDLRARRSYTVLFLLALIIVAIAIQPRWTLLVMAYTYLLSGLVGMVATRVRRRNRPAEPLPAETPPADAPPDPPPAG
ncbi:MAG TPA: CDP-diacylglycerol--serine O-phosphatidyltransferase [Vicinamibacterales bacterium]|nr:CDP-diacylglycerol--serine O-phosphatidyltransferase [Vicinamibacterales bacterium]